MTSGFDKAFVSFRLNTSNWAPDIWDSESRFVELLELFSKYNGICDEITFFTSDTHSPLPLDTIKSRADILGKRMQEIRKLGFSTGINILSTIGHHNENLCNSLSGDLTNMTDIEGNVCLGSFCPNDEKVRNYIRTAYKYITSARPDYIWIDDDIRLLGHMPIVHSCFCDHCLQIFKMEYGEKYTRESLKKAVNASSFEESLIIRQQWLQHNRNTIAELLRLIEKTVHEINPELPIGFMTGDRFFEGYDFDQLAVILSGPGNVEVRWRPGGGFYSDERLSELIGKSHDIGRQVSLLPECIKSIQSEIENFPYQLLKKGARITALEAASHIASGCTGIAFNILPEFDEPMQEYNAFMEKLMRYRPFYDLLVRELGRSKPEGVYTGWTKESYASVNLFQGDWFKGNVNDITGSQAVEMFELGIPAAYSQECANVTAISGDTVYGMNEKQIIKMLSSGVYMDAKALINLNRMGYSEFTGFDVERFIEEDCIEVFCDHMLNTNFSGRKRDCRQSFWKAPGAVLKSVDKTSETLAKMVDYGGIELASCCMGIYENKLGGRICAAGYYPWTFLQSFPKASQVRKVICWLSKYSIPAYIDSYIKTNIWVRHLGKDHLGIVLINSSLDDVNDVILYVRTEKKSLSITNMNCNETIINTCIEEGSYKKFNIPRIATWDMILVIL